MKSEKATPRKRERIREAGYGAQHQICRSAIILFLGIQIFLWQAPMLRENLRKTCGELWQSPLSLQGDETLLLARKMILKTFAILAEPLLLFFFLALGLFASFRELRSSGKLLGSSPLYQSLFPIVAMLLISGLLLYLLFSFLNGLGQSAVSQAPALLVDTLFHSLGLLSFVFLAFGILDWGFGKYRFEQNLKMTPKEIREEIRETQVDPHTKSARQEIWEQI